MIKPERDHIPGYLYGVLTEKSHRPKYKEIFSAFDGIG